MTRHDSSKKLKPDGYTLVVVVVVLTILMVLGAGAIRVAGSGAQGAIAHQSTTSVSACARAARDAITSQLRFMSPVDASQIQDLTLVSAGEQVQSIRLGHSIHDDDGEAHVASLEFLPEEVLGTGRSPSLHPRISSDFVPSGQAGSSAVRVVAVCEDDVGRTHEVEFLLRYGI